VDHNRFDALTRSLTGVPSRRLLLRAIAGAGLGLGAWRIPETAAARKKRRKKRKKHKPQRPPVCVPRCAPDKPCGGDGCGGSCGACPPSEPSCIDARCQCTGAGSCPNPPNDAVCKAKVCVNGTCAIVDSPNGAPGPNCGDPRQICQNGACVCIPECAGGTCGDDGCGGQCACADSAWCQAGTCIPCDPPCPTGERCVHGTCTCNPFANTCPVDATPPPGMPDLRCACGGFVSDEGLAACADGNSACDLSKPCATNDDCPPRSVCLLGCSDTGDSRRCSRPCN
jgi:hypothetical protein